MQWWAAVQILDGVIDAGLCDKGSSGPASRWARLPDAINGKPKYADDAGAPFHCRLVEWHPENRYTPDEIVDLLQLTLVPAGRPKKMAVTSVGRFSGADSEEDDVLTPKAAENPVITGLKAHGLYKTPLGSGKHDVTCPWVEEHTGALDSGSAYFEPDASFPLGGFCCQHSHGKKFRIRQLLGFLEVHPAEARNKPVIRIVDGDLHLVVDAAEKELAGRGRHYQSGGLIVSVSTDPTTGDPSIVTTSAPALTKELSVSATWMKFDGRAKDWIRCDPPARHISILYDAQDFRHLPPLAGLARQPYFRESDGELITQAGYDQKSHLYGVFDSRQFPIPEPTIEADRHFSVAQCRIAALRSRKHRYLRWCMVRLL